MAFLFLGHLALDSSPMLQHFCPAILLTVPPRSGTPCLHNRIIAVEFDGGGGGARLIKDDGDGLHRGPSWQAPPQRLSILPTSRWGVGGGLASDTLGELGVLGT